MQRASGLSQVGCLTRMQVATNGCEHPLATHFFKWSQFYVCHTTRRLPASRTKRAGGAWNPLVKQSPSSSRDISSYSAGP
ncbi:uncharacterized protein IUM83_12495 [Phytophthora cinnamomi]|uniref:uncharacterized protein n=1 Tax=Phytophthora cinnamomi TaxID=4785 RepID=UPI00355AB069|nr:hypothetical protein IUM83_12495 [Phytophthora cinnamomi]